MHYIRTVSGQRFFFEKPEDYQYTIEEIAYALSRVNRFNGHTDAGDALSVAQHSVFVSHCVPSAFAVLALLHDAAEFVTGDITKPLKRILDQTGLVSRIESSIQDALHKALGVEPDPQAHDHIKFADTLALITEQFYFQENNPEALLCPLPSERFGILDAIPGMEWRRGVYRYRVLPAEVAEQKFLDRWDYLTGAACKSLNSSSWSVNAELSNLLDQRHWKN